MSWTELRCRKTGCTATFKVADGVDIRDCHVCGTTHTPPWEPFAVDPSGMSESAKRSRERREAIAGEPTVVNVEISGRQAQHVARAAEAAGTSPDTFVRETAVSRATDELQLDDPSTPEQIHRAAVYDVLDEHDRLQPDDLYQEYARRVESPRTKRTVRTYLRELVEQGKIRAYGKGRARRYSCVG